MPHREMKSCTTGVSRYSLQLLQCFVWEPPPGLICWMWTASTYQYQRVSTRLNKRLRTHSTRQMHADRHNLACAKENLCRGHLTHALLVERARQTHCLSCAVDKRTDCRLHSTNAALSCRVHSTDAPLSCRVLSTDELVVECTRQRQCCLAERARQTSSALDRRLALLWSAIENQSVLSTSPLDNRIVTKSTLSCQHPTMLCIPIQRCPHITVPYIRNMLELPPTPFEYTSHVLGSRRDCTQGHLVPLSTHKQSPWPTQRSPVSG